MYPVKEIDVAELQSLLGDIQGVKLIDVRNPTEASRGAIPGAQNLPLHTLPIHADGLPGDETVVFYCQSGGRSAQACAFMASRGFDNVKNLRGGILAWVRSGLLVA